MTKLLIERPSYEDAKMRSFGKDSIRRIDVAALGNCPIDQTLGYVRTNQAQSCGKCVPCRVGLARVTELLEKILYGAGTVEYLTELKELASVIYGTADCAIGFETGKFLEKSLEAFSDEYQAHVETGICESRSTSIPCVKGCPAHVDVPAYIALAKEGRSEDAVRVIRNNNPFPSVCAYICEHPCEEYCRRGIVDTAINIRGIKKYIVDQVESVAIPARAKATGKSVGIVGGGPSGLTAAYYLALMGHDVTVYEQNQQLGGMLVFGIPRYRLPREALSFDVDAILSTGVKVEYGVSVGEDLSVEEMNSQYDAVYIAIGAHSFKSARIEGEDLEGVYSAVEVLHDSSGLGKPLDMSGKDVVVIGGGNVAMDVIRTAKRLDTASVKCVYRRRAEDMTALPEEIESAVAEDCEIMTLLAPVAIRKGENTPLVLTVQPQLPGLYQEGRPKPVAAEEAPFDVPCDIIVAAIGQDIESQAFIDFGLDAKWGRLISGEDTQAVGHENIFVGGDCSSGPETVIRAIEAGKVAAANIDSYLGYSHVIHDSVEIPQTTFSSPQQKGRVNIAERLSCERVSDFDCVELPLSTEAAVQECNRCLRCDHYGYHAIFERTSNQW